jgi:plastocyanin
MRSRHILAAAGVAALAAAVPAVAHDGRAHAASTHTVRMGEYFYRPGRVTIRAGDRVRFVNRGKIQHTVADSTRRGRIRSRVIKPRPLKRGQAQTVRLTRRGTVYYVCTFHPDLMRGRIEVR